MLIGSHVKSANPLYHAEQLRADIVQIFLGSPISWASSDLKPHKKTEDLSQFPTIVHAPYMVDLSSPKSWVYEKSVKMLKHQAEMAAEFGALGMVVHGGQHGTDTKERALAHWSVLNHHEWPTKILIENQASGRHAMTRWLEDIEKLWGLVGENPQVGFTLDTAHMWGCGENPYTYARDLLEIVGHVDLVHANGSAAEVSSGQDRHSPFHSSILPPELVVESIQTVQPDWVVVESRDPGHDIEYLRERLKEDEGE